MKKKLTPFSLSNSAGRTHRSESLKKQFAISCIKRAPMKPSSEKPNPISRRAFAGIAAKTTLGLGALAAAHNIQAADGAGPTVHVYNTSTESVRVIVGAEEVKIPGASAADGEAPSFASKPFKLDLTDPLPPEGFGFGDNIIAFGPEGKEKIITVKIENEPNPAAWRNAALFILSKGDWQHNDGWYWLLTRNGLLIGAGHDGR